MKTRKALKSQIETAIESHHGNCESKCGCIRIDRVGNDYRTKIGNDYHWFKSLDELLKYNKYWLSPQVDRPEFI